MMKMVGKRQRGIVSGIVVLMLTLTNFLMPFSTYALTNEQYYIFSNNGVNVYVPGNGDCIGDGSLTYAAATSGFAGLSAEQVAFVETYHDIAVQNSINYGIPWETVMAQGILESAAGTSYFAVNRNNFFGIGAFDSNPNNAYYYNTPEEGWRGYYENIRITSTYRAHGVFAGDTVTNPYAYLQAIKAAGYATDPDYIEKVSRFINAIEQLSEDRGWASSAILATQHPVWNENAERNRQGVVSDEALTSPIELCGGSLVSGGMTLEQAQEFMQVYIDAAGPPWQRGDMFLEGALVMDFGCPNGTLNNCSAFTQWFINRYTTIGPDGATLHQGSLAVSGYLSEHPELIDGGKVPRAYAIMSTGPESGSADGWSNHTGIVLGIDETNNKIIIGEASCGSSNGARYYAPGAHEYNLDEYTNNLSAYGPTYAYTDNVLKLDGS